MTAALEMALLGCASSQRGSLLATAPQDTQGETLSPKSFLLSHFALGIVAIKSLSLQHVREAGLTPAGRPRPC